MIKINDYSYYSSVIILKNVIKIYISSMTDVVLPLNVLRHEVTGNDVLGLDNVYLLNNANYTH